MAIAAMRQSPHGSDVRTTGKCGASSLMSNGPSKPMRGRFLRVINSPAFLWTATAVVTAVVSFVGFYYHTYTKCVADSRELWSAYASLELELFARQNDISSQILHAESVADLRKSIDEHKSFAAEYKDRSIAELHTLYLIRSELIDESGMSRAAETEFAQSKNYQRFSPVLYGHVPESIKEADFKDLQEFAGLFVVVQLVRFLTGLRSEAVIACIPANVFLTMLGEKPVAIQRYDLGSFTEKERSRLRAMSGRNVLPRRTPPAPFPSTTYKPDMQPDQAQ